MFTAMSPIVLPHTAHIWLLFNILFPLTVICVMVFCAIAGVAVIASISNARANNTTSLRAFKPTAVTLHLLSTLFGNPASSLLQESPVALRPRLTAGLPLSQRSPLEEAPHGCAPWHKRGVPVKSVLPATPCNAAGAIAYENLCSHKLYASKT